MQLNDDDLDNGKKIILEWNGLCGIGVGPLDGEPITYDYCHCN
jgi:hypothetical protein